MRLGTYRSALAIWAFCAVALGPHPGMEPRQVMLSQGMVHAMEPLPELVVLSQAQANSHRISLMDLFEENDLSPEWRTLLAGVDLGPSPEAGETRSINPDWLRQVLHRFLRSQEMNPESVSIILPGKITVVRKQVQPTAEEVEEVFRAFVLERIPWKSEDVAIQAIHISNLPALPAGKLVQEVLASPNEDFLGEVSVRIQFCVDGKKAGSVRVAGRVDLFQEAVHTSRPMKRNEVIKPGDLQLLRVNIADRPDRFVNSSEHVIGKRLLCNLGMNQPVSLRDVDKPLLLRRGDAVTIVYHNEGVRLTARGQAKHDGCEGDRVRITNMDSHRELSCRIIDSQTVEVTQ